MRQAETNRQICALQTQLEKYWEESGYKDEEKDIILIAAVLAISLISLAAIKMTQKTEKK